MDYFLPAPKIGMYLDNIDDQLISKVSYLIRYVDDLYDDDVGLAKLCREKEHKIPKLLPLYPLRVLQS